MSESSEALGKIVLNPSKAALPGLSVTPGLNPTETTASGVCENISLLPKKDWLVIDGGNTHFWSEIAINIAGRHT